MMASEAEGVVQMERPIPDARGVIATDDLAAGGTGRCLHLDSHQAGPAGVAGPFQDSPMALKMACPAIHSTSSGLASGGTTC